VPKPTTKAELLAESQQEHEALEQFIAALSPEEIRQGDRMYLMTKTRAAFLVKIEEQKPSMGSLRTFLVEHPALI
jgi:hypothetical protein